MNTGMSLTKSTGVMAGRHGGFRRPGKFGRSRLAIECTVEIDLFRDLSWESVVSSYLE